MKLFVLTLSFVFLPPAFAEECLNEKFLIQNLTARTLQLEAELAPQRFKKAQDEAERLRQKIEQRDAATNAPVEPPAASAPAVSPPVEEKK
jgi:hypothetical protein